MDPYRVLDVARDADQETIKKRYRKLARETHPDLNPGDEAAETRFKEVSVAYDNDEVDLHARVRVRMPSRPLEQRLAHALTNTKEFIYVR